MQKERKRGQIRDWEAMQRSGVGAMLLHFVCKKKALTDADHNDNLQH